MDKIETPAITIQLDEVRSITAEIDLLRQRTSLAPHGVNITLMGDKLTSQRLNKATIKRNYKNNKIQTKQSHVAKNAENV